MNDSLLSQPEATEAKMAKRRYVVKLTSNERKQLQGLIRKGKSSAKHQLKARILLQADESPIGAKWSDVQISEALGTYPVMCARVRRQWVEGGVKAVLSRKQRATPPVPRIFDGEKEAKLIALACSKPPEGHAKWTLRLLENKVVELNIVDHASDNTIGRVLKKTSSSLV
jgi:Homeodomain-like domain